MTYPDQWRQTELPDLLRGPPKQLYHANVQVCTITKQRNYNRR